MWVHSDIEHYKNNDDPEGLVELINKFLDVQTKIIINNKGTIDKYMGLYHEFLECSLDCEDHAESCSKICTRSVRCNEEIK